MGVGEDLTRTMWELAGDMPAEQPPEVSVRTVKSTALSSFRKGVTSNFEDPSLVGYHSVTIACGICVTLLVFFSAARLYSKLCIIRKITIDDCKCTKLVLYEATANKL